MCSDFYVIHPSFDGQNLFFHKYVFVRLGSFPVVLHILMFWVFQNGFRTPKTGRDSLTSMLSPLSENTAGKFN